MGGGGGVVVGEEEPESRLTPVCVCVLLCVSVGSLGPGASWKCLGSAEAANTSSSIQPRPSLPFDEGVTLDTAGAPAGPAHIPSGCCCC